MLSFSIYSPTWNYTGIIRQIYLLVVNGQNSAGPSNGRWKERDDMADALERPTPREHKQRAGNGRERQMKIWVAIAVVGLVGFGLAQTVMAPLHGLGGVLKFMQPVPKISLPSVELKSLSSKYGFLEGSFVITNANAFPVTNAAILCDVHEPGGTVVHTFNFVVHDLVPANGKKVISNYKFGFWDQKSGQMTCRSNSVERN
jgi:hypothetical protein